MKLTFIPDSELEKLPQVKTEQVLFRGRFHSEGIFSEQIFGPVKSYKCWCSTTTAHINQRCKKCGIELINSSNRRMRFATIKVDRIINPVVMEILTYVPKLSKIVNKILNMKLCVYMNNGVPVPVPIQKYTLDYDISYMEEKLKLKKEDIDEKLFRFSLDAIFELACHICDKNKGKSKILNKLREFIVHNHFFTKYILVIPPDLRPAIIKKNQTHLDNLNKYYLSALVMCSNDIILTGHTKYVYESKLQQISNQISKFVFESIGKKSGLLRNKMAGKRIDFSGRAVATPNPDIPLTHIKVSKLILLQLWKIEIAKKMIERQQFVTFKMAFDYIQRIYEEYNIPEDVQEIIEEVASDKFVIVNRQPTLHRGGMFAMKVIPQDANVISVNPLVCNSLNLDFDGDCAVCEITLKYSRKIDKSLDKEIGPHKKNKTITANIMDLRDIEVEI